ncbi:YecA family protein [Deferrisoma sp.]
MRNPVGRNAPCPCGSGRKYKRCCAGRHEAARLRSARAAEATRKFLDWAAWHYGPEIEDAISKDYFGELDAEDLKDLGRLPPGLRDMLDRNIGDWLATEAEIRVGSRKRRVLDLALEPGGLLLEAEERAWLELLRDAPMGLYEVVEVKPGDGVRVKDLLMPDSPPVWVVERSGSESLARWTVLAARIVRCGEDLVFSGGLYHFRPDEGHLVLEDVRRRLRRGRQKDVGRTVRRAAVAGWVPLLLRAVRPETLVCADVETGEPIQFVTDRYRVSDRKALATRIEARPDVVGDRKEGWAWVDGRPEDETRRIRAALRLERGDVLVVEARTLGRADAAREWVAEVAGDLTTHLGRIVQDPVGAMGQGAASVGPRIPGPMAPEADEAIRRVLREHYEAWPDHPLPALGGKTPREAVRTAKGREQVEALLKTIMEGEAQRARRQGGRPLDLGFLWKTLGLEPPGT